TTITFWPDPEIFTQTRDFSFDTLFQWLRDLCHLNPGLEIRLADHRVSPPCEATLLSRNGIEEDLATLTPEWGQPIHPSIVHGGVETEVGRARVAFRWLHGPTEWSWAFSNCTRQEAGGTHVTGFRSALTRTINDLLRQRRGIADRREMPSGEVVRTGLASTI